MNNVAKIQTAKIPVVVQNLKLVNPENKKNIQQNLELVKGSNTQELSSKNKVANTTTSVFLENEKQTISSEQSTEVVERLFNAVSGKLESMVDRLNNMILDNKIEKSAEPGRIINFLNELLAKAKDKFNNIKEEGSAVSALNLIREGFSAFKEFAKPLMKAVGNFIAPALRSMVSLFKKGWDFIKGNS